ncbi:mitochondrial uncoupling protein 2-like [Anopheles merus]|uniref:Mitochondrial brown fat uncoupling protein 1 n=1 Tax=Anopheles quadriannulatus TaxID=34691 RepID=A0A182XKM0_ANOQN|nr:mitochondrial uncoupling protein 2-like [Anopheles merus]XP_041783687.1 mitochondrial uncoupling protein 2-like [Anopheles merus]XP_041783688.1 mitochondrial uncoupling protein 2-like [Anopheles merus]
MSFQRRASEKTTELTASVPVKLLTAGSAACFADFITFPLDTAKVRLQIQGEQPVRTVALAPATINTSASLKLNPTSVPATQHVQYRGLVGTITTITRQEGFRTLYNGLSAGLQRQLCFCSIRLGLYDTVKTFYGSLLKENEAGLQIGTRVLAGLTTGGAAVMIAQPTDVVKVRFQAATRSSTGRRYASTLEAYRTIHREEGVRGLWRGAMPNVGRNAIVNVAEIVCYDVVKDCLLLYAHMPNDIRCHFSAAVVAGLAATIVASPVDVVKTRYMNSPRGQYRGAIDCAIRMGAKEGVAAFYKGFVPSFARLVSWNVVMWISYEQLKLVIFNRNQS